MAIAVKTQNRKMNFAHELWLVRAVNVFCAVLTGRKMPAKLRSSIPSLSGKLREYPLPSPWPVSCTGVHGCHVRNDETGNQFRGGEDRE